MSILEKTLDWRFPAPVPTSIILFGIFSSIAIPCLFLAGHAWSVSLALVLLAAWLIWTITIVNHPLAKLYRSGLSRHIEVWTAYKNLPAEVKSDLPTLTPASLLDMTRNEANELNHVFSDLNYMYKEKQKLERAPMNLQILESANRILTDMNNYTQELAKMK